MLLREWTAHIEQDDAFNFTPGDGYCYSCRADLVEHYQKTGIAKATCCPICRRSFVE